MPTIDPGRMRDSDDIATERPITDAFGTRLARHDLLAGLRQCGLSSARLIVRDGEVVLECEDPDVCSEFTARGLTWLRSKLSPLVPVRVTLPTGDGDELVDERTSPFHVVTVVEADGAPEALRSAVRILVDRIGCGDGDGGGELTPPVTGDAARDAVFHRVADALASVLAEKGCSASAVTVSALAPARRGLQVVGPLAGGDVSPGPHFLVWIRPGATRGVRASVLLAASPSASPLRWLADALCGDARGPADGAEILVDGLAWRASRRPTVAAPSVPSGMRIAVDSDRCDECGVCADVCPVDYLRRDGRPATGDVTACIRCYECVDACPVDAIRPTEAADTAMLSSALAHRPGWLSRLAGLPGPSFPGLFPPSYLLPKQPSAAETATDTDCDREARGMDDGGAVPHAAVAAGQPRPPRYVLGLAIMTMQEHAAALLRDGEVVGAIEHEKLVRLRHAGWSPPGRPGVTAAVDPTIALEEAFCRRPIRALLEREGITLDDIDVIAVNGLHGRYADQISFVDPTVPLPIIRTGRVVYLPHHLCHAASAYRMAGADDAWVFTVDGRGDRECASLWRSANGQLRPVDTLLSLTDRSIGGVYEGVTRILGFGSHGQGSVMALAAFGEPRHDFSQILSIAEDGTARIHESRLNERFGHLSRHPDEPLTQEHRDLAASLQVALEEAALAFVRRHVGQGPVAALALGGGVALNCRMNERLRRVVRPQSIFVQPGANDAGTALGAALEAWASAGGGATAPLRDAYLGPEFDDDAIEGALRRSGLRYERCESIARSTAERIARGEVVCWFQGRMEFGPRALGGRSILADPRRAELHARVNAIKQRESWRPFGPSILAGHEQDWIEDAFDSRFMLFTVPVRPQRRSQVPAVVHVDGTTRPQVVHADSAPEFHALISEFHRLSGVPMLLNTSFNRRGEPIVCSPDDAVEAFIGLGADVLAIGRFLVEREPATVVVLPADDVLQEQPAGRRLALRLTTRCDLDCGYCTLRDQHGRPDRSSEATAMALADGRAAGCDELVILRGEATLRDELPDTIRTARRMGYRYVQIQTNGVRLADARIRQQILDAGVDGFEIPLVAAEEALHDEITCTKGTLRPIVAAIRSLLLAGRRVLITVPVLSRNLRQLGGIVALAQKLGVREIQFNFPRPVELADRLITESTPRLSVAAPWMQRAAAVARQAGMAVSTEAFPFCHLPPELRIGPESTQEWRRHRIDDLHLLHESLATVRSTQRPEALPCRTCSVRSACPKTWALYLELFGSDELRPLTGAVD